MARRQTRFLKQQKMLLGTIGVLVVASLGYLTYLTVKDQPLGEFVEGEHYELAERPRRIRGDQIEVLEFFSYACVHCYTLDPDLTDWAEDQGDRVRFMRVPLASSGTWRMLGRAWYTMQAVGLPERHHLRFFRNIHEGFKQFDTEEKIQAFFEEAGVAADEFNDVFNSRAVSNQIARAEQMARRLQIAAVPTLVVQGKYTIQSSSSVGLTRMLDVASHLVERELTGEVPDAPESGAQPETQKDEPGETSEAAATDQAES